MVSELQGIGSSAGRSPPPAVHTGSSGAQAAAVPAVAPPKVSAPKRVDLHFDEASRLTLPNISIVITFFAPA